MGANAWHAIASGMALVLLPACTPGEPETASNAEPMNTPLGIVAQDAAAQDPLARRLAAQAAYADLAAQVDAMKSELHEASADFHAAMAEQYDRQLADIDARLADLCARVKAEGAENRELMRTYEETQRQRRALTLEWEIMKEDGIAIWDQTRARLAHGLDAVSARIGELASQAPS